MQRRYMAQNLAARSFSGSQD